MGDSGESLGARLRSRWPVGGVGVTAAAFVAAFLLVGGAGGIAQAVVPTTVRADESPIVDPIGPLADAPLVLPESLVHKEAGELTAVTPSWVPPAPRRSAGGGGGGGGGGSAASGVLGHTNAARSASGLAGLAWNGTLAERSCTWAAHLAAVDGGLAHSANAGGFGWWGENVASGYGSASAVVNGWMGSPPHRENILRPQFTVMGSCSATSSTGTIYWVQQFGG